MMKRTFLLIGLTLLCSLFALAQELPRVGDAAADAHIVRIAQTGWRSEGACLSYDGLTLYLSIKHAPKEDYDLYTCSLQDGRWQMPVLIDALSSPEDEWSPSVAPDEQTIYFIRKETLDAGTRKEALRTMIYFAQRATDGAWLPAQWMLLSNGADSHPRMLNDNKVLLFTSIGREETDKKQNQNFRYYVKKMDKYNWTLPQLVSAEITDETTLQEGFKALSGVVTDLNTQKPIKARVDVFNALTQERLSFHQTDERGQYRLALRSDMEYRIEVSCDGYTKAYLRPKQGEEAEIMNAVLSPDLVVRLGVFDSETMAPITATMNVLDGMTGKTANIRKRTFGNRGGVEMQLPIGGDYQITLSRPAYADTTFHFDTRKDVLFPLTNVDMTMRAGLVSLRLRVTDSETGEDISATVRAVENGGVGAQEMLVVDGSRLHCGTSYRFNLEAEGYFFKDTTLEMGLREEDWLLSLQMDPLRREQTIQLRNIQFEYNSYLLKEESFEELEKVAELLRKNPTLKIEMSAHTDDQGSAEYNKRLSEQRGKATAEYLIEDEGISAGRITWKGYGKERPLVPNDSEENRAINRRVEFQIVEL